MSKILQTGPRNAHPWLLKLLALRGVQYAASRLCGPGVAGLAFDAKFGGFGRGWEQLREPPEFVRPLAAQAMSFGPFAARILLLGCGTADLIGSLPGECYQSIIGVDLSTRAITICAQKWRAERARFEVADMRTYKPPEPQNLIVLSESIYYVGQRECAKLFARMRAENPGVVFVVTIAQAARYRSYFQDLRRWSPAILEDRPVIPGKPRHLLIFK